MMSENENESIESIVAEMRRREKSRYYPKVARNIMHQYAGRLEAAWKRERDRLMTEPRSWEECVERAMKVKENSDVLY